MADPLPRPSDLLTLPLDDWIEWLVKDQMVPALRPVFQALQWPVNQILGGFEVTLLAIPFLVFLAAGCAVAWRVAGRNVRSSPASRWCSWISSGSGRRA